MHRPIPHSEINNHISHNKEGLFSFSAHVRLQDLLLPRVLKSLKPGAGKLPSACPSTEPTQTCPPQGPGKEGQRMSWSCQDLTSSAKTGRKMIIVAVLLANSVNKAMTTVMRMTATGGGTPSKGCRRPPIHTDKPDSCKGESENSNHPPASLQGPGALLEPVLRVSHSKQLAGSCTPLSYVLCIAVTWG